MNYTGVVVAQNNLTYNLRFEYGVISYGSQTKEYAGYDEGMFEYGVISYGSQTCGKSVLSCDVFEYGVISYGSQTVTPIYADDISLSMV